MRDAEQQGRRGRGRVACEPRLRSAQTHTREPRSSTESFKTVTAEHAPSRARHLLGDRPARRDGGGRQPGMRVRTAGPGLHVGRGRIGAAARRPEAGTRGWGAAEPRGSLGDTRGAECTAPGWWGRGEAAEGVARGLLRRLSVDKRVVGGGGRCLREPRVGKGLFRVLKRGARSVLGLTQRKVQVQRARREWPARGRSRDRRSSRGPRWLLPRVCVTSPAAGVRTDYRTDPSGRRRGGGDRRGQWPKGLGPGHEFG